MAVCCLRRVGGVADILGPGVLRGWILLLQRIPFSIYIILERLVGLALCPWEVISAMMYDGLA